MTFRVKIISPIKIDAADLRRRRMRYSERAGSNTHIEVFNLTEGPNTLDTLGDLLFCEHAVFQEGVSTSGDDFDAIPAYEQIYALAGPIQTYRITGDPRILRDAELTVGLFDRFGQLCKH